MKNIFRGKENLEKYELQYSKSQRTSLKKNYVHFDVINEDDNPKSGQQTSANKMMTFSSLSSIKPKTFYRSTLKKTQPNSEIHNINDTFFNNLQKSKIVKFPVSMRKCYNQVEEIITNFLNSPIQTSNSIIRQLKCLAINTCSHESYLFPKNFITSAKQRLREANNLQNYTFEYSDLAICIKKIEQKCSDIEQILSYFNKFLKSNKFPASVELIILYIGVYLYQISSNYQIAENLCKQIEDLLLKKRLFQFIPIYLILMVKLKANLSEWNKVLEYISTALASAWANNLNDLQNWCYFEYSRAHFNLGNQEDCQFFRQRSEMSISQGHQSVFRQLIEQQYKKQIESINNISYFSNQIHSISFDKFTKNIYRQKSDANLKAHVYAKTITQNFKIKHVPNLIGRLTEDLSKYKDPTNQLYFAGNPQFLTHQSGIKNINVYFRAKQVRGNEKNFYTFQNSFKSSLVLKKMIQILLAQMKMFVPIEEI